MISYFNTSTFSASCLQHLVKSETFHQSRNCLNKGCILIFKRICLIYYINRPEPRNDGILLFWGRFLSWTRPSCFIAGNFALNNKRGIPLNSTHRQRRLHVQASFLHLVASPATINHMSLFEDAEPGCWTDLHMTIVWNKQCEVLKMWDVDVYLHSNKISWL